MSWPLDLPDGLRPWDLADPDVSDLDDGGFDRDEWCPPELSDDVPVSVPVVVYATPTDPDPEPPW